MPKAFDEGHDQVAEQSLSHDVKDRHFPVSVHVNKVSQSHLLSGFRLGCFDKSIAKRNAQLQKTFKEKRVHYKDAVAARIL